ncbi:MAG TPA: hypothetical protein VEZ11_06765 [Thermoanaerobaculia bacterium]|nr:hypothetical protein [Thermoanaerobaculia bacterium]
MKTMMPAAVLLLMIGCATSPSAPPPAPRSPAPAQAAAPAPQATVAAPAAVPKERTAAELVDNAGDSPETAIDVPPDAPNEGVDFQNRWIYQRYGRFRRLSYGLAHKEERHYDIITVELPDHSQHTVYFDITEASKAWAAADAARKQ